MKLSLLGIVYIRIISLRRNFDDHLLVEYPLFFLEISKFGMNANIIKTKNYIMKFDLKARGRGP